MPVKGDTALPEEFRNPAIIDTWVDAGMPGVTTWANNLATDPRYADIGITSDMLKRQLMDALRDAGHTIQSYRESYSDVPPEPTAATLTQWQDRAIASSVSETIRSLDDLLKACEVDLSLWYVAKHRVKTFPGFRSNVQKNLSFDEGRITGYVADGGQLTVTTMYSVEAWLEPRTEQPYEAAFDKLLGSLAERGKRSPITPKHRSGSHLFVPALFDVHFGRRSVDGTYTVERVAHEFGLAGDALIARALAMGMSIDRILLPVGNDILNADNLQGSTTKGTWQEMAADQRDTLHAAFHSYITFAENLLEVAPVDIVVVESNHDRYSTFALGMALEAYFSQHKASKHVTINNTKAPRKYYQYGANLIGMEHGDKVKASELDRIMANEVPELWGATTYRTFFRGHFHKEYSMYAPVAEKPGVRIETFPAFCPLDMWEWLMGYSGKNRRAEGRFYHRENGPAGMFPVFVDEL